ncbi:MAG: cofactor-independent phosphoglycerate mutase [Desulfomonile tiedjei]|nr:cofactor-independent phosphoglycerate mutase [Desulfomonile tiedjei]
MSSDSKTKYLILVPDGMADSPVAELDNITPLKAAKTPWMDRMASAGHIGLTRTVPQGMDPGSDIANLSIMGYPPSQVYTGRAPFEAASMGVRLRENDLAFRLNLVTLERNYTMMADHSADHISTQEAREIIAYLAPEIESMGLSVLPGVSYRNLLVWRDGPEGCITHAPHDFPGEPVAGRFPTGNGADVLLRLIIKSWKLLEEHPVNKRRITRCQGPANSIWPWGQGRPPRIKTVKERFGITGSVVAAVDLIRGIGKYAGLDLREIEGATGYLDTNYQGKVDAALNALKEQDFVFLHVEAPDEASHSGQLDLKMKAIEDFDEKIVGPMLAGLAKFPRWRILLMPDHHTPTATRVHSADPVPFIVLDSKQWKKAPENKADGFSEDAATASGKMIEDATKMIEILLNREKI